MKDLPLIQLYLELLRDAPRIQHQTTAAGSSVARRTVDSGRLHGKASNGPPHLWLDRT
jgi:hypothetical protein